MATLESTYLTAFVAYPEAVTKLPVSPLWSFLFFTMLITLGLDSQFTGVETLITAMMDEWPSLRKRKASVVLGMCVIFFVLGLPLCANGGVLMFTLMCVSCSNVLGLFSVGTISHQLMFNYYKPILDLL